MPSFELEQKFPDKALVFGIDEVGRGPWAGPVMAACVCWPNLEIEPQLAAQINDSKKLSAVKREKIYELILNSNAIIGVGQASPEEIDRLNILQATFLAMKRALKQVEGQGYRVDYCLIDGNRLPDWSWKSQAVVKGDSISLSIAAASIVAKVLRDRLMVELGEQYPFYHWGKNAGYGTKEHIEGLKKYGVSPYHRKSYAPIKTFLAEENTAPEATSNLSEKGTEFLF